MLARQLECKKFNWRLRGTWLQMKSGPFEDTNRRSISRVDDGSPPLESLERRRGRHSHFDDLGTVSATAEVRRQCNADGADSLGVLLAPRVPDSFAVKPDNESSFG